MNGILSPLDIEIGQLFAEDCAIEVFRAVDIVPYYHTTRLVGEVVGYLWEPKNTRDVLPIGSKQTFAGGGPYGPELFLVEESNIFTPEDEN